MKKVLLFWGLAIAGGFAHPALMAQSPCDSCALMLPGNLPADTLFLGTAPEGRARTFYQNSMSFRLPKTTTPVAAVDPTTPPGLPIQKFSIDAVNNLPPGLSWTPSQRLFEPNKLTDGCVTFCGVPLQPGLYEVEVVLTATVIIVNRTTSFTFPMLILPAESSTQGFAMENNEGCSPLTVAFTNRNPSQGAEGFSYAWDFGNGRRSIDEDPGQQTYSEAGEYVVSYRAVVDTFGYSLTSVKVLEVSCNDPLNGKPDIKIELLDATSNQVYLSPTIENADFPLSFEFSKPLQMGSYTLRVLDDDNGLIEGKDDVCGVVNLNAYSNGILQDVGMKVSIVVTHPVDTLIATDTIRVYDSSAAPQIGDTKNVAICAGTPIELKSNQTTGNQWLKDNVRITGADSVVFLVNQSGVYSLEYTNEQGCVSISEPLEIFFNPLPAQPKFVVSGNELTLDPGIVKPKFSSFRWYLDGEPLPGEVSSGLCIYSNGKYTLTVKDEWNGCESSYTLQVNSYDAANPCLTTSARSLTPTLEVKLYPNPFKDFLNFEIPGDSNSELDVTLYDLSGRPVLSQKVNNGVSGQIHRLDVPGIPGGMYLLQVKAGDLMGRAMVVKQ